MAGWDIIEANRRPISPAVMSVFDRKARIRRRGAEESFEPVVRLPENPLFITSTKAIRTKNLVELIAWVKGAAGRVLVATSGVGTPAHVAGVLLQHLAAAPVQLVHYRGGAPALQDLIAGQVDVNMNQAPVFLPYLKDDCIRIYAVFSKARLPGARYSDSR